MIEVTCPHDIAERDIAVSADGYCPLCQAAKLKRLTIVAEAKAHAHLEYIVLPKRNFMRNLRGWSGPVYDFAVVTRTD
jgi:hypothetical protein